MNIIKEQFKTLESMIDIMDRRPVNKAFKVKEDRLSSQRVEDDKDPWAGTKTWAGAMDLVKNGYSDPLKKMKTEITRIGAAQTAEKRIRYNDVIGFIPNVPNALRGVPLAMINQKRIPKKVNAISLIYSLSVSANVGPAEMIKAGINFISLVNMLEKKGYRVKIDISFIARTNTTTAGFLVTAKEYNQTLNLLKLAFPLVQPAMLRRVAFKWLETTPEMKDPSFPNGYGTPITRHFSDPAREKEFLKKSGYIVGDNTYYVTTYDAMSAKTVDQLCDKIGIKLN